MTTSLGTNLDTLFEIDVQSAVTSLFSKHNQMYLLSDFLYAARFRVAKWYEEEKKAADFGYVQHVWALAPEPNPVDEKNVSKALRELNSGGMYYLLSFVFAAEHLPPDANPSLQNRVKTILNNLKRFGKAVKKAEIFLQSNYKWKSDCKTDVKGIEMLRLQKELTMSVLALASQARDARKGYCAFMLTPSCDADNPKTFTLRQYGMVEVEILEYLATLIAPLVPSTRYFLNRRLSRKKAEYARKPKAPVSTLRKVG